MPPKGTKSPKSQVISEGLKESVKVHQDIQKSADPSNPTTAIANLLDTTQLVNSLTLAKIAQKQLKEMVQDLDGGSGPSAYKPQEPTPQAPPIVSLLEKLPEDKRSEWLEKNKEIVPKFLAGMAGAGNEAPFLTAMMGNEAKGKGSGQLSEFAEVVQTMVKTGLLNQSAQSAGMQDMFKMLLLAKEMFSQPQQSQQDNVAIVNAIAQIAKAVQESNAAVLARIESMSGSGQNHMYEKLLEIQRSSFESQKAIQDQLVQEQLSRVDGYTQKLEQQLAAVREEMKQKPQGPSLEPLLAEIRQLRAANTSSTTDKDVQLKEMDLSLEKLKLEQEHQRSLKELELKATEAAVVQQHHAQRDAKLGSIVSTLMNYGRAMTLMNSMESNKTSDNVSSLMEVKI